MGIQPVFNEYKTVEYICQYFSKTEDQSSQVIKKEDKEAFENRMHHHDSMKTIAKAYLSNLGCFVEEAVYHILPELKLRRIFPAVYFVNTNLPEERVQVSLPEYHLLPLPYITYIERPNVIFCNEKYSVLKHFCCE